ncbi:MAG: L-threonylcarbamoyladenylate synthase [Bacillota bacterium]
MHTKIWRMAPQELDIKMLQEAAQLLKEGEVIGFPTETVYGLGADALNPEGVKKIFAAKGRPMDNPLIVHVCSQNQVEGLVESIPPEAVRLMKKFWPGPLTLVLPKAGIIPDIITAGLETVAVRMPSHPVALRLIELAGIPVAAPSANKSGKPSPTTAEHVWQDLQGKIAGIIDGGRAGVGVESTVLDLSCGTPTILRPGGITREQLEAEIGQVNLDTNLNDINAAPRSPGMKYTHYSPDADLIIVQGNDYEIKEKLSKILLDREPESVGVMISQEIHKLMDKDFPVDVKLKIMGTRQNMEEITSNLFDTLRWFDHQNVSVIYAESFPQDHIGAALMNRLYKAAGGKI